MPKNGNGRGPETSRFFRILMIACQIPMTWIYDCLFESIYTIQTLTDI